VPIAPPRPVIYGSVLLPTVKPFIHSFSIRAIPKTCRRRFSTRWAVTTNRPLRRWILRAWPSLSPGVRSAAIETLLSRPASIGVLFDALERGKIKTSEMDPARMALLRTTADATVKSRAEKLFAGAALSKRADVIAAYKGALDRPGNVEKGQMLFRKHCALCHRLENFGEQIGASLSGIRERGPEFLLVNILDPNREVLPKFLSYQAQTDAGRTLVGMIQNETATSVTLRRPDGTSETIPRASLESLRTTGVSYMPEGFETHLSVAEMADLIAYLLATAVRGESASMGRFCNSLF